MEIRIIDQNDRALESVIALGKRNANKLGLFPRDAFIDHAKKRWIIIAEIEGKFAGYILFRYTSSKSAIYIAHLCVDDDCRNKGTATILMDELKRQYKNLSRGIGLSCRLDYTEASNFWKKSGFIVKRKIRSRSKKENYLQKWWYDFGNPDLFSPTIESYSKKRVAVLDINILIKMRDSDISPDEEIESFKNSIEWIDETILFYVAQETYNEIMRDADNERAAKTRDFISNYNMLSDNKKEADIIYQELKSIVRGESENDNSDRRQLAESIAAKADYFITSDQNILDNEQKIWDKYQLDIYRPLDFALNLDSNLYQDVSTPNVYEATYFAPQTPQTKEIEILANDFLFKDKGERKTLFRDTLIKWCCDFTNSIIQIIKNKQGENGALLLATLKEDGFFEIIHIRIKEDKVVPTLFNQLISNSISLALEKGKSTIKISETFLSEAQIRILASFGFSKIDNTWIKVALKGIVEWHEILDHPQVQKFNHGITINEGEEPQSTLVEKKLFTYSMERKLYPVKVKGLDLPTYIVPIKPYWASQLFDYHAASETLFGAKASLVWNRENIYYRSEKPVSEIAPGRILWYSSSDEKSQREKAVVACSYLDEVLVDSAKALFSRFKNYGIYQWEEIYNLAQKDSKKRIKALRFSDTEIFKKPIPFKTVQNIMQRNNQSANTFASPVQVSEEIFMDIYKIGSSNV